MQPIVRIEQLGKEYDLGETASAVYGTLRDTFMQLVTRPLGRDWSPARRETIWALRDVSFDVLSGEVLGIIGRNGAGKSTLLKILSRITDPTEGRVSLWGRVGSLLEVGTGFHPELTGSENIYLNAAIIGMTRREIDRKFDEIVAFSELERFLDTPVKRYSSGMYMRLGFAVAAHLDPEILVVDEVLAVGDAQFQKKCLGKMGDVARGGRTVVFVSHNMVAVQSLCDRVVWLDQGRVVEIGDPGEVVARYLKGSMLGARQASWPDIASAPGNERLRLRSVAVTPDSPDPDEPMTIRTPLRVTFEYWNLQAGIFLQPRIQLFNESETLVFTSAPVSDSSADEPLAPGRYRSQCFIPGDLLNEGVHKVDLVFVRDESEVIYRFKDIVAFEIHHSIERRGAWYGRWPGAVHPNLKWETVLVGDLPENR